MKSEAEIRTKIKEVEERYDHVLKADFSSVFATDPRALLQTEAAAGLAALYWVLEEQRPKYDFEKKK